MGQALCGHINVVVSPVVVFAVVVFAYAIFHFSFRHLISFSQVFFLTKAKLIVFARSLVNLVRLLYSTALERVFLSSHDRS